MATEEELIKQGWTKRFTASGERLKEMIQMYQELGFEVHLEPVEAEEFPEECQPCYALQDCMTLYTRKPPLETE